VPYQGGERKILNKVNGYAKPGVMVALVGASGAGKTTLLNTLSQRQSTGVVSGEMLVDGKGLGKVRILDEFGEFHTILRSSFDVKKSQNTPAR
jgi:ABC-type multidrug transport system ATPase subunit